MEKKRLDAYFDTFKKDTLKGKDIANMLNPRLYLDILKQGQLLKDKQNEVKELEDNFKEFLNKINAIEPIIFPEIDKTKVEIESNIFSDKLIFVTNELDKIGQINKPSPESFYMLLNLYRTTVELCLVHMSPWIINLSKIIVSKFN